MGKIGIFTTTSLETRIDIEEIVTLHYFHYTKNFAFSGEKHNFWEIAYVDQGEVGVVAESKGFDLHQGEAIFHKPNEYHNIWAKNQYANVIILSFVTHSPAMSFFENKLIKFSDEHRMILAHILKAGEECFKDPLNDVHQTQLIQSTTAPFGGLQVIKNNIELLLISLIQEQVVLSRTARASDLVKSQGENQIVDAVKQYIGENVYSKITMDDVLRTICFSKSYITRLFREHTGESIMGYYNGLKITEAQKLISERCLSFTEIAELLCFNSIHHFSNSFKLNTGMTPTEYRKSVQSFEVL